MIFFTGIHQPSDAAKVPAAMVSAVRLRNRRSPFPARRWLMDSGAFSEVSRLGGYAAGPEEYATTIRRFARCGRLLGAVSQDFMCEPFILARTGMTIEEHQTKTIERYDMLKACDTANIYIMPVLQGYSPAEYVEHLHCYGTRISWRAWVGVGSLCKRNSHPARIEDVLLAIKTERPDLRLHGFGVKSTALGRALVRDQLFSADSMAWSFAARYEGRDGNSPIEAVRYATKIRDMPVQLALAKWGAPV